MTLEEVLDAVNFSCKGEIIISYSDSDNEYWNNLAEGKYYKLDYEAAGRYNGPDESEDPELAEVFQCFLDSDIHEVCAYKDRIIIGVDLEGYDNVTYDDSETVNDYFSEPKHCKRPIRLTN